MKPKKEKKEKKFKVKLGPKCSSDEVSIAVGSKVGTWECKKCGYKGTDFINKEMTEEEYFDYLDSKEIDLPELGEPETVEEKKSHKELLKEKMEKGEKI